MDYVDCLFLILLNMFLCSPCFPHTGNVCGSFMRLRFDLRGKTMEGGVSEALDVLLSVCLCDLVVDIDAQHLDLLIYHEL